MVTTIDRSGRLVVPKAIRDELGLNAGQELEVRVEAGKVIIEPRVVNWYVEQRGRLAVLVPDGPVPPLTNHDVREALERGRDPEARMTEPC